MGTYLTFPKREKVCEDLENERFRVGASGMQGWRRTMEDSHIVELDLGDGCSLFGVYDGHGGNQVADFVKEHLITELKKLTSFQEKDYGLALKEAYLKMDEMILTEYGAQKIKSYERPGLDKSLIPIEEELKNKIPGCTACTVIVTPTEIICANAGDSRAVMAVKVDDKLKAIPLSFDQKPTNQDEKVRIQNAGGKVEEGRINGIIAVARSIGDFDFKKNKDLPAEEQMLTANPEIKKFPIDGTEQYIVLACDGIWDKIQNDDIVTDCVPKPQAKISTVINQLFDSIIPLACQGGVAGTDNMTCIIAEFKK